MSPIFVRPVREQLEHDRLIRHLQARYNKKFDAAANVGDEQAAPIKIGANTYFPDLVLTSGKKLAGLVEVESGESTNNLEAMAQWVHFAKVRAPFHLYVPVQAFDVARRLCAANHVKVAEIWTYRAAMDGFDLVRMFHDGSAAPPVTTERPPAPPPVKAKPAPAAAPAPVPAKKPAALPKPAVPPKPVASPKPAASPKPVASPKPAAAKAAPAKKPVRAAAKPTKSPKKAAKAPKSKRSR